MSIYDLLINGFQVQASFRKEVVSNILLPLLRRLASMQKRLNRRLIVFLVAPPASGKSTLASFLEMLSLQDCALEPVQPLGIDGFHYHQEYILTHTVCRDGSEIPMKDVKGCPESYDIEKLSQAIQAIQCMDIKWPLYDRRLHDVVEDAIDVNKNIVLIEGNWLLLNEADWINLRNYCDFSMMLRAEESVLKNRLIERKQRGGLSREEATRFYSGSDQPNIVRCLRKSANADMTLYVDQNGFIAVD
jgi:putative kinase